MPRWLSQISRFLPGRKAEPVNPALAASRPGFLGRPTRALIARFDRYLTARADTALPRQLNRKCIFIVPTRFGFFYAAVMALIVGGGLNFNNNSALMFGFLFVAIAWVSMHQTFNNLNGLTLLAAHPDQGFAGEQLPVRLDFKTADGQGRTEIVVDLGPTRALLGISSDGEARLDCALPTDRRGWLPLPPLRVSTVWPFGLFYAWGYFRPQQQGLVYPRPLLGEPALPEGDEGQTVARRRAGGEDFAGLRDYQAGDPPRRIAWKSSARQEELLVQQLEHPSAPDLLLSLERTPGRDLEERLSRLTRWVLMAERRQRRYRLQLGAQVIGPDGGAQHRERCLRALALYGLDRAGAS
jgi:uncharacterized protein (DUF58 family)